MRACGDGCPVAVVAVGMDCLSLVGWFNWLPGGLGDDKQSSPRANPIQCNTSGGLRPSKTADYNNSLVDPSTAIVDFSQDTTAATLQTTSLHSLLADQLRLTTINSTSTSQWPQALPSRVPTGRTSLCPSLHHSHTPDLQTTWTRRLEHPRETTPPSSRPCRHPRAAQARTACHQALLTSPMSSPMP
jgi:hypothetical protein